jgi:hypothetical protein
MSEKELCFVDLVRFMLNQSRVFMIYAFHNEICKSEMRTLALYFSCRNSPIFKTEDSARLKVVKVKVT